MRQVIIAGNWKMHGDRAFVDSLLTELTATIPSDSKADWLIFPPFPFLAQAQQLLANTPIAVGAQNMHDNESGAFTGEVSSTMLKDLGCQYVLLGHSERRHVFGETSEFVARKVAQALKQGLIPVVCVGETLEERKAEQTEAVIQTQLAAVFAELAEPQDIGKTVIAYEPVWAIGTGEAATPELAQAVHAFIRKYIGETAPNVAQSLPILYGGSVKPANAAALFAMEDIDGGLIGGAALKATDFVEIGQCIK